MQQTIKNMKRIKTLFGLSLMIAFASPLLAGSSGGSTTTTTGAFSFTYHVGTVTNYHVYGVACQVGAISPRPANTVVLGNWWVWDLGKVSGTGTVSCPKPVTPKGVVSSVLGILLFADAADVGGQAYKTPVIDVQIFNAKWYNGYASVQVIPPVDGDADDTGIQLYWGKPFTPFAWDISAYVWNSEPSTW